MPHSAKVLLASLFCVAALAMTGCGSSAAPPQASISADQPPVAETGLDSGLRVPPRPRVVFTTSLGNITVELDRVQSPLSVNNFLNYVLLKQYDQTIFHQVDPGFMALAGGFNTELREIPADFPIRNEAHNGLKNTRGTIAMARPANSIDGATSQFFFNLADTPSLDYQADSPADYGYCVFGKVVAGMDVLEKIGAVTVIDKDQFPKMPRTPVIIESIRLAP